ncbi:hypothetical protein H4R20_000674 [Coemansia guatemalensis]|uniref:Uncharacterized protein n=1 Tax=Coemansia guatemalensis TaxID=2761395 RepID=A0A9W8LWQ7_9FUNG|nr:hypothetical protein H4R20_000674 [Coemansia guatemalensis]
MAGSVSTAFGLLVGLLKLKETLVVDDYRNAGNPNTPASAAVESGAMPMVTESTPLVAATAAPASPSKPLTSLSLLSVVMKQALCAIALMALGFGMGDQIYPIFAATEPGDGGLGFGTQEIGCSLAISGVAVLYLLLVVYPKMERRLGALRCYQIGLRTAVVYFLTIPFLSPLAAHLQQSLQRNALNNGQFSSYGWISRAGVEYGVLWALLVALVLVRITGNILSYTSSNIIVTNIAPSKNSLGFINGLQELAINSMRALGPLISGTLWAWSIKHSYFYPFNSHLVWVLCGVFLFAAWRVALRLPSSVNVFAAGRTSQNS